MNLSRSSTQLSKSLSRLCAALLVLAFVGFADAAYLTAHHYIDIPLPCTLLKGCEVVTTSVYSTIGPVPIALLGALYYISVFFLILLFRETQKALLLTLATALVSVAFVASLGLVYLQGVVLHAWCQYCLLSVGITTLLFVLTFVLRRYHKLMSVNV